MKWWSPYQESGALVSQRAGARGAAWETSCSGLGGRGSSGEREASSRPPRGTVASGRAQQSNRQARAAGGGGSRWHEQHALARIAPEPERHEREGDRAEVWQADLGSAQVPHEL